MRWVLLVAFLVCGVLAEASMPEFPPSLEINYNTIAYQIPEVCGCGFCHQLVPGIPSKNTQLQALV